MQEATAVDVIIENTPDPVLGMNRDGIITYANQGAIDLLGEVKGHKVAECYFPADEAEKKRIGKDIVRRLIASPNGRLSNVETELCGRHGELLPINASISILRDKNGRIEGFVSISKDFRNVKTLIDVGQSLLATDNMEDILKKIASVSLDMQQSHHAYIGLFDEKKQQIVIKAVSTTADHHAEMPASVSIENGILNRVRRTLKTFAAQENSEISPALLFPDVESQIIAPIKSITRDNGRAKFLGIIGVDSHKANAFNDHDSYFLTTLAGQAAVVIENSNLITSKVRTITELQALEKVLETITTTLDIDQILESLLDAVYDVLGFDFAALAKVDRTKGMIGTEIGRNVTKEFLAQAWHGLDSDDIQAWIVRNKKEIYLTGWDNRLDRAIYKKFGHDKLVRIFLPILSRDQAFGTLETGYYKSNREAISENEKEILRKVVKLAGTGIDQVYLLDEQRILVEQLQALNHAGSSIQSSRTEEEAVNYIFDSLKRIGYPKGLLSLVNKSTGYIEGRYARGANWQQVQSETKRPLKGDDILSLAIRQRKSLLSKDCATDPRCDEHAVHKVGVQSQYVIPLYVKDDPIGTLQIDLSSYPGVVKGPEDVLERRMRVLDTFARQISIAIRNIRDIKTINMLKTTLMETAHEFRSPLHNILTQIGGLKSFLSQDTQHSSEIDDIFQIINEEAKRASRQMENTLLFSEESRVLRGYHFEKGYIQNVVKSCANNYRLRALERSISIIIRDNLKRLPPLYFDKQKITQVFNNLIDNAVKYSHYSRFVQIQGFDDGSEIHIEVWDKGLGIPESEYDNIFEGLFRGSIKDNKRYIPGTGLGLKISQEIAKAHGGEIRVKSTPFFDDPHRVRNFDGYDTKFTVTLPKKFAEK